MMHGVSIYDAGPRLVASVAVLDEQWRQLLQQWHDVAGRWNQFQDLRLTRDALWRSLRQCGRYDDLPAIPRHPDEQRICAFVRDARGTLHMMRRPLVTGGSGLSNNGSDLIVTQQQLDGAVCVSVGGEVDLANVGRFRAGLATASLVLAGIVLDLRNLRYLDSSGINALLETQRNLAASGRHIALVGPSKMVRRILGVLDLERLMPVFASVDEALAYLRAEGK